MAVLETSRLLSALRSEDKGRVRVEASVRKHATGRLSMMCRDSDEPNGEDEAG